MADTVLFPEGEAKCQDCKAAAACYKHWGPLVPKGEMGLFCGPCFATRGMNAQAGGKPYPIGHPESITVEFHTSVPAACAVVDLRNGVMYQPYFTKNGEWALTEAAQTVIKQIAVLAKEKEGA